MRLNALRASTRNSLPREDSNDPAAAVDRPSTGERGTHLAPLDDRTPTSLELLRQLEEFVRELLEMHPGA
jgi:hypothetical protein